MAERLAPLYDPETLARTGVLLALPAAAVLLLWGSWALIMYLLRNAPEEPAAPDDQVRNAEAAFRHHGYRVSFGVFGYSLLLFAACFCGVLLGRLLVTSQSGRPTFVLPAHPGLLAAFAVLFPASASLAVTSFLTIATAASYGAALAETAMLRALWLTFAGVGCGLGAGLSAWLYRPASIWVAWVVPGGFLLALGVRELLAHNETGRSTLSVARTKARGVRSDIARELVDRGLAAEGRYSGESPFLYWARIAGAGLLPILFFSVVGPLFLGAVSESPRAQPDSSDLLSFGIPVGCLFSGFAFLCGRWLARSIDWDSSGATVTWYWRPEARFVWEDIVWVSARAVGEAHTRTLLVRTREGHRFAILANRPGWAQLRDVLVAHAYRQND